MTRRRLVPVRSADDLADTILSDPVWSSASWSLVVSLLLPFRPIPNIVLKLRAWWHIGFHFMFTQSSFAEAVGCTTRLFSGQNSCQAPIVGLIIDTVLPIWVDPLIVTSRHGYSGDSTSWMSCRNGNRSLLKSPRHRRPLIKRDLFFKPAGDVWRWRPSHGFRHGLCNNLCRWGQEAHHTPPTFQFRSI